MPLRKEDEGVVRRIEEAWAEIDMLRDTVIRLAASMMWERGAIRAWGAVALRTAEEVEEAICEVVDELQVLMASAADTAVAKPVAEARVLGMAKNSAPTESVCACLLVKLDLLGPDRVAPLDRVLESSGMVPKDHVLESAGMASKGHLLESSEMAPKGHVLESAEIALKDRVLESSEMAPEDHQQLQSLLKLGFLGKVQGYDSRDSCRSNRREVCWCWWSSALWGWKNRAPTKSELAESSRELTVEVGGAACEAQY